MKKTNAIRILDQHKIKYEILPYSYDSEHLNVSKIAADNNLSLSSIFKTLVLISKTGNIVVAVIPGHTSLDLKAVAKSSGEKKLQLLPTADLEKTTGYIRGGCAPMGMKKEFPVFIDEAITTLESMYVNAGKRGLLVGLAPVDLVKITAGQIRAIGIG